MAKLVSLLADEKFSSRHSPSRGLHGPIFFAANRRSGEKSASGFGRKESFRSSARVFGSLPKCRLINEVSDERWEFRSRFITSSLKYFWKRKSLRRRGENLNANGKLSISRRSATTRSGQMRLRWWMERALWESLSRITIDDSNYKRIFQLRRCLNHVKLFSQSFHFCVVVDAEACRWIPWSPLSKAPWQSSWCNGKCKLIASAPERKRLEKPNLFSAKDENEEKWLRRGFWENKFSWEFPKKIF